MKQKISKINREDMLELTRRMTSSRANFTRVAGAYMDEEGYVDGTFNTNYYKLAGAEKTHTIAIAKEVVFAETNKNLIQYSVPGMLPGSIWQMLYALRECDLKNDALLLNLYEMIGEKYHPGKPYAIYVYHGMYDVPLKASDKEELGESEEVYSYLIVAVCPLSAEDTASMPDCGFLYPAFTDRSTDLAHVNVFQRDPVHPAAVFSELLQ